MLITQTSLLPSKLPWLYNIVIISCLVIPIQSDFKIWAHDNSLENPDNFQVTHDCSGTVFPENLRGLATLRNLSTSGIVLPQFGTILLEENAKITLIKDSNNCIRIKPIIYQSWLDPHSWKTNVSTTNRALPHIEQLPCRHDTVIFPGSVSTMAVQFPEVPVTVKGIQINGQQVTQLQFKELQESNLGYDLFRANLNQQRINVINIDKSTESLAACYHDNDGCLCHNEKNFVEIGKYMCASYNKRKETEGSVDVKHCYDAFAVLGHCELFCGASLRIKPSILFDLHKLKTMLSEYNNIDFHANKMVTEKGDTLVQVIITDSKKYMGESPRIGEEIYDIIMNELNRWNVLEITLTKSGGPYQPFSTLNNGLMIVLSTLLVCLFLFSTLYVVYMGENERIKKALSNLRLPRTVKTQTETTNRRTTGRQVRMPFGFARFENREEGSMSMGSSLVSLDAKSFDNPLYGATGASVSTQELSTNPEMECISEIEPDDIVNGQENPNTIECGTVNPMYNVDVDKTEIIPEIDEE